MKVRHPVALERADALTIEGKNPAGEYVCRLKIGCAGINAYVRNKHLGKWSWSDVVERLDRRKAKGQIMGKAKTKTSKPKTIIMDMDQELKSCIRFISNDEKAVVTNVYVSREMDGIEDAKKVKVLVEIV
jgi:hypothetical protein